MKTQLTFNTKDLIKNVNSPNEFYEIKEESTILNITKKYNEKRGRPFSVMMPKEIKISPEVVGLIVGEGFIGNRNFIFANSNERAIKEVIDFLKQFNLPLKFYLEISVKNQSKEYVEKSKHFWENYLKLKLNKIRLREEFYSITSHGNIHITLNNSLFSKILKQIISISKSEIEKNTELSIGYLKGIIAAEGNINVKKSTGCVYMVRISASKKEEREHYKRCLKKAGIDIKCKDMPTISKEEGINLGWKTTHGRAGAVIISGWENFIKILQLNLLELHQEKQEKFSKYFINNKFTIQFLSFKPFIGKEFTMKEAQTHFNFKGRHLNRILTLYKQGYLSRRKINEVKFLYRLTGKYLKLYAAFQSILPHCSKAVLSSI